MKITIDGIKIDVDTELEDIWMSAVGNDDVSDIVHIFFLMDKVVDGGLVGVWKTDGGLEGTLLDLVNRVIPILKGRNEYAERRRDEFLRSRWFKNKPNWEYIRGDIA